jgi:uncharacterized protein involved in exopolysaccharide biosynthesis
MNTATVHSPNFAQPLQQKSFSEYIEVFQRRYKGGLLVFSFFVLVATVIAIVLPSKYRSTATILIEQQEIPEDLVRTTVTSYADQRIQSISQRVMTRKNLIEIIQKYNLYEEDRKTEFLEEILEEMRDDINMSMISADVVDPRSGRPTEATIAFKLSYESETPELAQKVTNELTSLYLNENLRTRTEMATEAEGFLGEEAEHMSRKIAELEAKLANFKERHFKSLPELITMNLRLMERTESEISDVEQRLSAVRERKIYLESELAQISPNLSVFSENGERILSPNDRLKSLEAKYITMKSVYSGNHPDILKIRKEIAALKDGINAGTSEDSLTKFTNEIEGKLKLSQAEYAKLQSKYADDHPDIRKIKIEIENLQRVLKESDREYNKELGAALEKKPDNPAYIQLQAQLQAADAELSSLLTKKVELENRLANYEERITNSPQIEREFKALSRDYENSWSKYQEIKAKQMEARLAKELETERKGERFTLIDPPQLPEKPVSPNRWAILFIGFVLSVAIGLGVIFLKENMDKSIRGSKNIVALLQTAPLAGIPYMEIEAERNKVFLRKIIMVGAVIIGMGSALALIHFFKIPLDVLWYGGLRRLGVEV